MKKTKILILAVSLLLLLVGCAKKTTLTEITTKKPVTYTGDKFAFHYNREDGKYNNWALWLWATGKDGAEFKFNGEDEYGAVATIAHRDL